MSGKKILFLDRDGTLIVEPELDKQVDSLDKLEFCPKVFKYLSKIVDELDFELVMVTNQDGLGTSSFPEESFLKPHNKMLKSFENEGIRFSDVLIDPSFPEEKSPNRKPEVGMLKAYIEGAYDLENSFVIGDRLSDVELAKNLGSRSILYSTELRTDDADLCTSSWKDIYDYLRLPGRIVSLTRNTSETRVLLNLNLDGQGNASIDTGIPFFDHMLEQLAKHGQLDLQLKTIGDLEVDEHHTIEDTAITLGEAFKQALGNKLGIERYGFCLPMDDCLAQVALDFGGRNWLVWEAEFNREMIGQMPTEMFFHFFKSFSDGALCNLNIKAEGGNEHHKIESIFKCFAKAIKMAKRRESNQMILPSTKGVL
ncbi:MAG: bifunctional histidinol-phosphatase/imidazoleglycerol-phosphate dehydratase HisB [Flavobacteriales bacterium]|nr:bifunctional histidinol-phosphatase/imidazoleglycerol-phosphate dehydratase HisB [Flavobacteriales bacterium]